MRPLTLSRGQDAHGDRGMDAAVARPDNSNGRARPFCVFRLAWNGHCLSGRARGRITAVTLQQPGPSASAASTTVPRPGRLGRAT